MLKRKSFCSNLRKFELMGVRIIERLLYISLKHKRHESKYDDVILTDPIISPSLDV